MPRGEKRKAAAESDEEEYTVDATAVESDDNDDEDDFFEEAPPKPKRKRVVVDASESDSADEDEEYPVESDSDDADSDSDAIVGSEDDDVIDSEADDPDEDSIDGSEAEEDSDPEGLKKKKKKRAPKSGKGAGRNGATSKPRGKKAKLLAAAAEQDAFKDYRHLKLKKDHRSRPVWVGDDGSIFLEAFSPIYSTAYDFLIAIAEPVNRPRFIHEYQLTPYSLYAAVSVGLTSHGIMTSLEKMSKVELSKEIKDFILEHTESYGKAKLVLKNNKYLIESRYPDVLRMLLNDEVVQRGKVEVTGEQLTVSDAPTAAFVVPGTSEALKQKEKKEGAKSGKSGMAGGVGGDPSDETTKMVEDVPDDLKEMMDRDDTVGAEEGDGEGAGGSGAAQEQVHSFEIERSHVANIKDYCFAQLNHPLVEEYDFRNDRSTPQLDIDLKPLTTLRPYQEKALNKMFGNGRARSGLIVLPCGAGKTLVGVTAACTVRKRALVLTTNAVSVEQWRSEFRKWANIPYEKIARFTSTVKDEPAECGIVISTYTMFSYGGTRSAQARRIMNFIREREWGILILDEVHVVPAETFRKVIHEGVGAHCKLGLTATLVREDDHITDLNFLVGPKLYEANWMDLQRAGYIARVSCAEVWCPMTGEFYRKYLEIKGRHRTLLWTMNPNKFRACQYLIQYHEERGDKIIVFSDDVFTLKAYAMRLQKHFLYGKTSQAERLEVLEKFKKDSKINCIFCSKIADNAIDLPDANVLIQISSHYGSRRQEAQRLGRILRAKRGHIADEFNAYFYTLVSQDTQEMSYSLHRQQFLVDQGYAFQVVTSLPPPGTRNLYYGTAEEQRQLLRDVLAASDELVDDSDGDDTAGLDVVNHQTSKSRERKQAKLLADMSGGNSAVYMETSATAGGADAKKRAAAGGRKALEESSAIKKMMMKQNRVERHQKSVFRPKK